MQIIIDIPEKKYNLIQAMDWKNMENLVRTDEIYKAIHNGQPLPKNHGRLIDATTAKEVLREALAGTGYQLRAMDMVDSPVNIPTIIKASGESEDEP